MRIRQGLVLAIAALFLFPLSAFSYYAYGVYTDRPVGYSHSYHSSGRSHGGRYYLDSDTSGGGGSMPSHITPQGEKVIIVDPRIHAWGAYGPDGTLIRSGLATAGSGWCPDLHRPCRTRSGTFRIYSLGSESCRSRIFPLPHGGAPMPYCMYFHGGQALHGSPEGEVVNGNISHGCVRMHVADARWLRFDFVEGPNSSNHYRGTKVIIRGY